MRLCTNRLKVIPNSLMHFPRFDAILTALYLLLPPSCLVVMLAFKFVVYVYISI